ncbi:MAG: uroporphyrinogen-III decarboxylase-like protein [Planctomycetes bacterium]|nr:uroporphyrinogen-III decarboxylase-like protein [Planctomycetota bacterium]
MPMTPRERWLALLNRQKPDRIPTDFWGTQEVRDKLIRELKCKDFNEVADRLHIDGVEHLGAKRLHDNHPDDPQANIWGVRHRAVDYGTGKYDEVACNPLADVTSVEQVHAFKWPDPHDCDWDDFGQRVKNLSGRKAVQCGGYEPFLLYCAMRGMEQAMVDLIAEPQIAEAIFEHLFDFHYRLNGRMWELAGGKADMTYVAEDLGSQHSLLMSLDLIRKFILPRQKKMADLARSHKIRIFYHTDGAARDVIPDLISVTGIEVLNPIQWRCPGMEREGLVRDFGKKIGFHGAVDNQRTLPFGTPQDVRNEVLENIRIFAWPTRWICAPCHNLQAVSPTGNVVAMYDTIWENGKL